MAVLLLRRLVARGWDRTYIKSLILSADSRLRSAEAQSSTTPNDRRPLTNKERLFLHYEYHPNGMPRGQIRQIYQSTCGELLESRLGIKQMTVAYSRPKNIRDVLVRAKLHQAPGHEASTYFQRGGGVTSDTHPFFSRPPSCLRSWRPREKILIFVNILIPRCKREQKCGALNTRKS